MEVTVCTNELPPAIHSDNYTNIRYVPPHLNDKYSIDFMNSPERLSENPHLKLEGRSGTKY